MRNLLKFAFIAITLSFFAFNANSALAQSRRQERKEYRREVRQARKEYRKDVRQARRDYRSETGDRNYKPGVPRGRAYGYYNRRPNVGWRNRVNNRRSVRSGVYRNQRRHYRIRHN